MDSITDIAKLLSEVSETPLLEARILVEAAGNSDDKLKGYVARRLMHEPVSKIIGRRGFWKSDFVVSSDVLDPRPDSETLIEAVLKADIEPARILDIGTGSGCLLLTLLDEFPAATGVGIDVSEKALEIAQKNRGDRKVEFIRCDLNHRNELAKLGLFDVVISNPPYIPTEDIKGLAPDVQHYDPMLALDGGRDGLDAYRALAQNVPTVLREGGLLFLEIGIGQEPDVVDLFAAAGFTHIRTEKDLGRIPRVVVFQK